MTPEELSNIISLPHYCTKVVEIEQQILEAGGTIHGSYLRTLFESSSSIGNCLEICVKNMNSTWQVETQSGTITILRDFVPVDIEDTLHTDGQSLWAEGPWNVYQVVDLIRSGKSKRIEGLYLADQPRIPFKIRFENEAHFRDFVLNTAFAYGLCAVGETVDLLVLRRARKNPKFGELILCGSEEDCGTFIREMTAFVQILPVDTEPNTVHLSSLVPIKVHVGVYHGKCLSFNGKEYTALNFPTYEVRSYVDNLISGFK